MSTRQNNNKNLFSWAALIVPGIVGILFIVTNYLNSSLKHRSSSAASTSVNPLMKMLSEGTDRSRLAVEGIAIGIAIDVSGSMNDSVLDGDSSYRRKIEIARRCAVDVLNKAHSFARGHPDQIIEAGIFEFSSMGSRPSCRQVIPFGPIETAKASAAVGRMHPEGGTPIGDAIITVKQKMNARGLKHVHLLVITDGENNQGYDPADVVNAISRMPDQNPTSVYFFAFDISADKFRQVRDSGGLVMAASNGLELERTLDYVLTGKILVEQPEVPKAK